ncbi:endonuclease/exonuclease/phosphatase family protein [Bizionia sediminis]|uniref:Endonuclease/exonuclease/phosphatase family protein n=1 Tax=Bizionia sediminis TaxID=1737064 RepID=A0ABW5KUS7_9FLAO
MRKKWLLLMVLGMCLINNAHAQTSYKLMFYNLLNFPSENTVPNRLLHLQTILMDYQPDIFMVCELNNEAAAINILQVFQERIAIDFEMAAFQLNTSDDTIGDSNAFQNMLFYNGSKFQLDNQTIIPTLFRDFNHYKLELLATNELENRIFLDVIVGHLKASRGVDNEALRLRMVNDLMSYLNTFPEDSHVILAGDFNVYTSSEPAFQALTNPNNTITFTDPANSLGNWHNNASFASVFTQSTRTRTDFGGSSGGMDDRFDFMMTSSNLNQTGTDLYYEPETYQVYGNNGNPDCFNKAIISPDCDGSLFTYNIREALHLFSDHLPVTMEISTTSALSVPTYSQKVNNPIEILGSNYVQNSLQLKVNETVLGNNQNLYIYNTIGQLITHVPVTARNTYNVPLTHLSAGIYYIVGANWQHIKPLKFIKTP